MKRRVALILQNPLIPFIYRAAAAAGVEIVHVHLPGADVPASLPAVREAVALDVFADRDGALAELGRRHRARAFDGVLTLNEAAVPFTAELAERLGLHGVALETARVCRDKWRQRRLLERAGLNGPGFVRADSPVEATALARGLRLPVVVKPANGLASQGVSRADTVEAVERAAGCVSAINAETLAAYADVDRGERLGILVEEFVEGPEFCVESFTHAGTTHVLGVAYKGNPTGPYFEEGPYRTPPALPAAVVEAIHAEVRDAHRALGIATGASHTELRLRGGTTPVILEVGARMGGSGVVHCMVEQSTGIDFARLVLLEALGQAVEPLPSRRIADHVTAANWIVPLGGQGRYAGLGGLGDVRRHPDTIEVLQFLAPGTEVPAWPRFTGYPGFVLSRHRGYAECVAYQEWLSGVLRARWTAVDT